MPYSQPSSPPKSQNLCPLGQLDQAASHVQAPLRSKSRSALLTGMIPLVAHLELRSKKLMRSNPQAGSKLWLADEQKDILPCPEQDLLPRPFTLNTEVVSTWK